MAKPNWKNRTLFHGDNLNFLRAMNSESVDLIATDPPFNKGRDFHATPESLAKGASFQDRWSWERDVHQEWIDQLIDDHPNLIEAIESARHAHSDGMGAYMCFMDAVFGSRNFVNEIIWCYKTGGASPKYFAKKHDIILYYSKGLNYVFNNTKEKSYMGIGYSTGNKNVTLHYDDKANTYGPYTLVNMKDWWEIPMIATSNKTERTGYPTQKPLALYERIVKASSNKGDIVLDPFAGCATTCVAAESLNRKWVGIDIWDKAHGVVVHRLSNHVGLFGKVHYIDKLPKRTDDFETAAPFLQVKQAVPEPPGQKMSRQEIYEVLLSQQGPKCQGCDRKFDDVRYLELDHNTPRSDGGLNHISNRIFALFTMQ